MNLGTWKSIDGGTTFTRIRVPHGDTHVLWIDPKDPQRMIHGERRRRHGQLRRRRDVVEQHDNQPTAQFYHVITDDQFPYRIYGAQQDNTTVSIASRSDDGAITRATGSRSPAARARTSPSTRRDPNIIYGGGYMGEIDALDRAHEAASRDVAVWLDNYDGWAAKDVPYRFAWTFPLFFSQHDSNALYTAAQYLFQSTERRQARGRRSRPTCRAPTRRRSAASGGPIHGDMTGTEWYAMAFAVAESPLRQGLIWAGSDDGLVHLTRDGGTTWDERDADRASAPFTQDEHRRAGPLRRRHGLHRGEQVPAGRLRAVPLEDATTTAGPGRASTPASRRARTRASIREDPVRRGLLYAGTETGVYVSFDDGAHWQSLQLNLPRASVRDLAVQGQRPHRRHAWPRLLDPRRRVAAAPDQRLACGGERCTSSRRRRPSAFQAGRSRPSLTAGQNPFSGVYVDYWLKQKPRRAGEARVCRRKRQGDPHLHERRGGARRRSATRRAIAYTASDSLKAFTAYDTTGQSSQRKRIEGDSVSNEPADSVVQRARGSTASSGTSARPACARSRTSSTTRA